MENKKCKLYINAMQPPENPEEGNLWYQTIGDIRRLYLFTKGQWLMLSNGLESAPSFNRIILSLSDDLPSPSKYNCGDILCVIRESYEPNKLIVQLYYQEQYLCLGDKWLKLLTEGENYVYY